MVVTFTQGYRLRANPGLELANAFGVIGPNANCSERLRRYRAQCNVANAFRRYINVPGSAVCRPARAIGLRQHSALCRRSRPRMERAL